MSGLRHPFLPQEFPCLFEVFIYLLHDSWEHGAQEMGSGGWGPSSALGAKVLPWTHGLPGTQSLGGRDVSILSAGMWGGRLGVRAHPRPSFLSRPASLGARGLPQAQRGKSLRNQAGLGRPPSLSSLVLLRYELSAHALFILERNYKDVFVCGKLSIKRPQASYVFVLVLAFPLSLRLESQVPPSAGQVCRPGLCLQDGAEGPWRLRSCVSWGWRKAVPCAGGAQRDACRIDLRRRLVTTL